MLVFWIIVRIVKSVINEDITNLLWYLYYLPMIFIPTLYYLCSKKILENQKNFEKMKKNFIVQKITQSKLIFYFFIRKEEL